MTYNPDPEHIYLTSPEAAAFLGVTKEEFGMMRLYPRPKPNQPRPLFKSHGRVFGGYALYRLADLIAHQQLRKVRRTA